MEFMLERGIKMPKRVSRKVFPFSSMEIGNSFIITNKWIEQNLNRRKDVYILHTNYAQKSGKSFSYRSVNGGIRVWRTA